MVRWFWKRWVWACVFGTTVAVGLTLAQAGKDQPSGPPKPGDVITLKFRDGPERQVKILKSDKQPDGSYLSEVKDTKTGETFTLLDRPADAQTPPAATKTDNPPPVRPRPADPLLPPKNNPAAVPPKATATEKDKDQDKEPEKDRRLFGSFMKSPATGPRMPEPPEEDRPGLLKRIFGRKKSEPSANTNPPAGNTGAGATMPAPVRPVPGTPGFGGKLPGGTPAGPGTTAEPPRVPSTRPVAPPTPVIPTPVTPPTSAPSSSGPSPLPLPTVPTVPPPGGSGLPPIPIPPGGVSFAEPPVMPAVRIHYGSMPASLKTPATVTPASGTQTGGTPALFPAGGFPVAPLAPTAPAAPMPGPSAPRLMPLPHPEPLPVPAPAAPVAPVRPAVRIHYGSMPGPATDTRPVFAPPPSGPALMPSGMAPAIVPPPAPPLIPVEPEPVPAPAPAPVTPPVVPSSPAPVAPVLVPPPEPEPLPIPPTVPVETAVAPMPKPVAPEAPAEAPMPRMKAEFTPIQLPNATPTPEPEPAVPVAPTAPTTPAVRITYGSTPPMPLTPVEPVAPVATPVAPAVAPVATPIALPAVEPVATPEPLAMPPAMRDIQSHVVALQSALAPSQRILAARALAGGRHGSTDAVKGLLFHVAKNDPCPLVRVFCIDELCKLGYFEPAFLDHLKKACEDSSDDVRAAAKAALTKMSPRK